MGVKFWKCSSLPLRSRPSRKLSFKISISSDKSKEIEAGMELNIVNRLSNDTMSKLRSTGQEFIKRNADCQ